MNSIKYVAVSEVFDPHLTPMSLSKQHFGVSHQKNRGGKGIKKSRLNRMVAMCSCYLRACKRVFILLTFQSP
ncbi:unnamed protein product [Sphenostylis stenocarpa]|uniref:Uncharacterized protein n=1 Tax=Sphenostylis stenocarpa TaxID=92480 RepID=A0AA86STQ2_9FABA|nr:unnamed protein product [Sphenostylis stenocarpa]